MIYDSWCFKVHNNADYRFIDLDTGEDLAHSEDIFYADDSVGFYRYAPRDANGSKYTVDEQGRRLSSKEDFEAAGRRIYPAWKEVTGVRFRIEPKGRVL